MRVETLKSKSAGWLSVLWAVVAEPDIMRAAMTDNDLIWIPQFMRPACRVLPRRKLLGCISWVSGMLTWGGGRL